MSLLCLADMAALKARTPVAGDAAWIPHHTTSGDGGGGFFVAVDTAVTGDTDVPDQGIYIVGDAHRTTVINESASGNFNTGITLACKPIVSNTLSFAMTSTATCTDMFLHGHTFAAGTANPWMDYSAGTIDEQSLNLLTAKTESTISVTYDYATSTLRWKRVWDGRLVDLRWWAPAKTDAAAIADRNLLCWALEHAKRLGAEGLVLNCDIRQHGTIELPDSLPVYGSSEPGSKHSIKVADNKAEEWSYVAVPVHVLYDLTMGQCSITPKSNAKSITIENLEWDGNIGTNQAAFDDPTIVVGGDAQHVLNLQDAPSWSFLYYNGHNGRTVNANLKVSLKNVEYHDSGSHGIVGHGNNGYMTSENIKAYNFRIGRPFYSIRGDHKDWTFEGYSDDEYARVADGTRMRRVRFVNLTNNPHSGRGVGPLISVGGYHTASDPDAAEHNVREAHVSDVYADVQGSSDIARLFWWGGEGNVLENVTLWFNQANMIVFSQVPNRVTGTGHWWMRGQRISNVQIIAGADYHLFGTNNAPQYVDNAVFENFDLRGDVTVATPGRPLTLFGFIDAAGRGQTVHANVDMSEPTHRKIQRFDNINVQDECGQFAYVDIAASNAEEVYIYVTNSRLMLHSTLQADRPMRAIPDGNPAVSDLTGSDLTKLRFYFENCQMQATANVTGSNSELSLALSRWRNCEDKNGRRSDEGGLYEPAVAVGGEDFVDIPTNLWHTPKEMKVEPVGQDMEDAGIARLEAVDSGGTTLDPDVVTSHEHDPLIRVHFVNALAVNDVIKLRWTASVRPFEST